MSEDIFGRLVVAVEVGSSSSSDVDHEPPPAADDVKRNRLDILRERGKAAKEIEYNHSAIPSLPKPVIELNNNAIVSTYSLAPLRALRTIDLSFNALTDTAVTALALPSLPHLSSVDLSNNMLTAMPLALLRRMAPLAPLRTLLLPNNPISLADPYDLRAALAAASPHASLTLPSDPAMRGAVLFALAVWAPAPGGAPGASDPALSSVAVPRGAPRGAAGPRAHSAGRAVTNRVAAPHAAPTAASSPQRAALAPAAPAQAPPRPAESSLPAGGPAPRAAPQPDDLRSAAASHSPSRATSALYGASSPSAASAGESGGVAALARARRASVLRAASAAASSPLAARGVPPACPGGAGVASQPAAAQPQRQGTDPLRSAPLGSLGSGALGGVAAPCGLVSPHSFAHSIAASFGSHTPTPTHSFALAAPPVPAHLWATSAPTAHGSAHTPQLAAPHGSADALTPLRSPSLQTRMVSASGLRAALRARGPAHDASAAADGSTAETGAVSATIPSAHAPVVHDGVGDMFALAGTCTLTVAADDVTCMRSGTLPFTDVHEAGAADGTACDGGIPVPAGGEDSEGGGSDTSAGTPPPSANVAAAAAAAAAHLAALRHRAHPHPSTVTNTAGPLPASLSEASSPSHGAATAGTVGPIAPPLGSARGSPGGRGSGNLAGSALRASAPRATRRGSLLLSRSFGIAVSGGADAALRSPLTAQCGSPAPPPSTPPATYIVPTLAGALVSPAHPPAAAHGRPAGASTASLPWQHGSCVRSPARGLVAAAQPLAARARRASAPSLHADAAAGAPRPAQDDSTHAPPGGAWPPLGTLTHAAAPPAGGADAGSAPSLGPTGGAVAPIAPRRRASLPPALATGACGHASPQATRSMDFSAWRWATGASSGCMDTAVCTGHAAPASGGSHVWSPGAAGEAAACAPLVPAIQPCATVVDSLPSPARPSDAVQLAAAVATAASPPSDAPTEPAASMDGSLIGSLDGLSPQVRAPAAHTSPQRAAVADPTQSPPHGAAPRATADWQPPPGSVLAAIVCVPTAGGSPLTAGPAAWGTTGGLVGDYSSTARGSDTTGTVVLGASHDPSTPDQGLGAAGGARGPRGFSPVASISIPCVSADTILSGAAADPSHPDVVSAQRSSASCGRGVGPPHRGSGGTSPVPVSPALRASLAAATGASVDSRVSDTFGAMMGSGLFGSSGAGSGGHATRQASTQPTRSPRDAVVLGHSHDSCTCDAAADGCLVHARGGGGSVAPSPPSAHHASQHAQTTYPHCVPALPAPSTAPLISNTTLSRLSHAAVMFAPTHPPPVMHPTSPHMYHLRRRRSSVVAPAPHTPPAHSGLPAAAVAVVADATVSIPSPPFVAPRGVGRAAPPTPVSGDGAASGPVDADSALALPVVPALGTVVSDALLSSASGGAAAPTDPATRGARTTSSGGGAVGSAAATATGWGGGRPRSVVPPPAGGQGPDAWKYPGSLCGPDDSLASVVMSANGRMESMGTVTVGGFGADGDTSDASGEPCQGDLDRRRDRVGRVMSAGTSSLHARDASAFGGRDGVSASTTPSAIQDGGTAPSAVAASLAAFTFGHAANLPGGSAVAELRSDTVSPAPTSPTSPAVASGPAVCGASAAFVQSPAMQSLSSQPAASPGQTLQTDSHTRQPPPAHALPAAPAGHARALPPTPAPPPPQGAAVADPGAAIAADESARRALAVDDELRQFDELTFVGRDLLGRARLGADVGSLIVLRYGFIAYDYEGVIRTSEAILFANAVRLAQLYTPAWLVLGHAVDPSADADDEEDDDDDGDDDVPRTSLDAPSSMRFPHASPFALANAAGHTAGRHRRRARHGGRRVPPRRARRGLSELARHAAWVPSATSTPCSPVVSSTTAALGAGGTPSLPSAPSPGVADPQPSLLRRSAPSGLLARGAIPLTGAVAAVAAVSSSSPSSSSSPPRPLLRRAARGERLALGDLSSPAAAAVSPDGGGPALLRTSRGIGPDVFARVGSVAGIAPPHPPSPRAAVATTEGSDSSEQVGGPTAPLPRPAVGLLRSSRGGQLLRSANEAQLGAGFLAQWQPKAAPSSTSSSSSLPPLVPAGTPSSRGACTSPRAVVCDVDVSAHDTDASTPTPQALLRRGHDGSGAVTSSLSGVAVSVDAPPSAGDERFTPPPHHHHHHHIGNRAFGQRRPQSRFASSVSLDPLPSTAHADSSPHAPSLHVPRSRALRANHAAAHTSHSPPHRGRQVAPSPHRRPALGAVGSPHAAALRLAGGAVCSDASDSSSPRPPLLRSQRMRALPSLPQAAVDGVAGADAARPGGDTPADAKLSQRAPAGPCGDPATPCYAPLGSCRSVACSDHNSSCGGARDVSDTAARACSCPGLGAARGGSLVGGPSDAALPARCVSADSGVAHPAADANAPHVSPPSGATAPTAPPAPSASVDSARATQALGTAAPSLGGRGADRDDASPADAASAFLARAARKRLESPEARAARAREKLLELQAAAGRAAALGAWGRDGSAARAAGTAVGAATSLMSRSFAGCRTEHLVPSTALTRTPSAPRRIWRNSAGGAEGGSGPASPSAPRAEGDCATRHPRPSLHPASGGERAFSQSAASADAAVPGAAALRRASLAAVARDRSAAAVAGATSPRGRRRRAGAAACDAADATAPDGAVPGSPAAPWAVARIRPRRGAGPSSSPARPAAVPPVAPVALLSFIDAAAARATVAEGSAFADVLFGLSVMHAAPAIRAGGPVGAESAAAADPSSARGHAARGRRASAVPWTARRFPAAPAARGAPAMATAGSSDCVAAMAGYMRDVGGSYEVSYYTQPYAAADTGSDRERDAADVASKPPAAMHPTGDGSDRRSSFYVAQADGASPTAHAPVTRAAQCSGQAVPGTPVSLTPCTSAPPVLSNVAASLAATADATITSQSLLDAYIDRTQSIGRVARTPADASSAAVTPTTPHAPPAHPRDVFADPLLVVAAGGGGSGGGPLRGSRPSPADAHHVAGAPDDALVSRSPSGASSVPRSSSGSNGGRGPHAVPLATAPSRGSPFGSALGASVAPCGGSALPLYGSPIPRTYSGPIALSRTDSGRGGPVGALGALVPAANCGSTSAATDRTGDAAARTRSSLADVTRATHPTVRAASGSGASLSDDGEGDHSSDVAAADAVAYEGEVLASRPPPASPPPPLSGTASLSLSQALSYPHALSASPSAVASAVAAAAGRIAVETVEPRGSTSTPPPRAAGPGPRPSLSARNLSLLAYPHVPHSGSAVILSHTRTSTPTCGLDAAAGAAVFTHAWAATPGAAAAGSPSPVTSGPAALGIRGAAHWPHAAHSPIARADSPASAASFVLGHGLPTVAGAAGAHASGHADALGGLCQGFATLTRCASGPLSLSHTAGSPATGRERKIATCGPPDVYADARGRGRGPRDALGGQRLSSAPLGPAALVPIAASSDCAALRSLSACISAHASTADVTSSGSAGGGRELASGTGSPPPSSPLSPPHAQVIATPGAGSPLPSPPQHLVKRYALADPGGPTAQHVAAGGRTDGHRAHPPAGAHDDADAPQSAAHSHVHPLQTSVVSVRTPPCAAPPHSARLAPPHEALDGHQHQHQHQRSRSFGGHSAHDAYGVVPHTLSLGAVDASAAPAPAISDLTVLSRIGRRRDRALSATHAAHVAVHRRCANASTPAVAARGGKISSAAAGGASVGDAGGPLARQSTAARAPRDAGGAASHMHHRGGHGGGRIWRGGPQAAAPHRDSSQVAHGADLESKSWGVGSGTVAAVAQHALGTQDEGHLTAPAAQPADAAPLRDAEHALAVLEPGVDTSVAPADVSPLDGAPNGPPSAAAGLDPRPPAMPTLGPSAVPALSVDSIGGRAPRVGTPTSPAHDAPHHGVLRRTLSSTMQATRPELSHLTVRFGNDFPDLLYMDPTLRIYLGGIRHVTSTVLDALAVNTIVSCGNTNEFADVVGALPSRYNHLYVTVDDSEIARIDVWLSLVASHVLNPRPDGHPAVVLVHCFRGASRSPTVASALLMIVGGDEVANVLAHVRRCRGIALPNSKSAPCALFMCANGVCGFPTYSFVRQLSRWAHSSEYSALRTTYGRIPSMVPQLDLGPDDTEDHPATLQRTLSSVSRVQ